MSNEIFVDSGAWIAISDKRDQYHAIAKQRYAKVIQTYRLLVTTNLVVAEAYVLIRRHGGFVVAMNFLKMVNQSNRLLKIYANATLEQSAETILRQYTDQDFSYVDAVSFALMTHRNIETAFTFDHHFQVAGFTLAN